MAEESEVDEKQGVRASKMARWAKVLAAQPDGLGSHMAKGETWLLKVVK